MLECSFACSHLSKLGNISLHYHWMFPSIELFPANGTKAVELAGEEMNAPQTQAERQWFIETRRTLESRNESKHVRRDSSVIMQINSIQPKTATANSATASYLCVVTAAIFNLPPLQPTWEFWKPNSNLLEIFGEAATAAAASYMNAQVTHAWDIQQSGLLFSL